MGLSPEVKEVAQKLVHTPKSSMLQAVDCSKMDAYKLLQDAFSTLDANITAENATIHAHDAEVHLRLCFRVHLRHAHPFVAPRASHSFHRLPPRCGPQKPGEGQADWGRGRAGKATFSGGQAGRKRAHGACRHETRRRSWLGRKLRRWQHSWRHSQRRCCCRAGGPGRRALRALFVHGVLAGTYCLSGSPRRLCFMRACLASSWSG